VSRRRGQLGGCKKVRAIRTPNGYFAHSGRFQDSGFLLVDFVYPSMKQREQSLADFLPLLRRDLPPSEITMHVTLRWLGRPFEDWHFDSLLQAGRAGDHFADRADEMYGLQMRKESGLHLRLRKQQFIPANRDKTAVVECRLPWRSVDGSRSTDVPCHVWSKLGNEFYIEYAIERKDLP
jgi:hypothetical protein